MRDKLAGEHPFIRLSKTVCTGRELQFLKFVEIGSGKDYAIHAEMCEKCRPAVEAAFDITAKQMQDLGKAIQKSEERRLADGRLSVSFPSRRPVSGRRR